MSELYTTLGQSTLASGYTIGDPTIDVIDASSFPASGTFSVRLSSGVIYTVTGVSGDTLSITLEFGTDADVASGETVIEVMTARSLRALLSQFITGPFTPPVNSDFSWHNQGGASVVDNGSSVFLNSGPGSGGYDYHIREMNVPSTPYTLIAALRPIQVNGANQSFAGITLSDGTKIIGFGMGYPNTWLSVWQWSVPGTSAGNPYNDQQESGFVAQACPLWLKISDDGVDRKYYVSPDGFNWLQVYTEATNTYLTPTKIGFGVNQNVGSSGFIAVTLFSWKLS